MCTMGALCWFGLRRPACRTCFRAVEVSLDPAFIRYQHNSGGQNERTKGRTQASQRRNTITPSWRYLLLFELTCFRPRVSVWTKVRRSLNIDGQSARKGRLAEAASVAAANIMPV